MRQSITPAFPLCLLLIGRSRLELLDGAQDKCVVTLHRPIFDAVEEPKRRTVLVATIDRSLRATVAFGCDVVALERLIADGDVLGTGFLAAIAECLTRHSVVH